MLGLVLAGALFAVPGASAAELLSSEVSAADAESQSCIDGALSGAAGVAQRSVRPAVPGFVTARLSADSGDWDDWDLAIFEAATGKRVAGSAFWGSDEIAQGFVAGGQELVVQACRRSGAAESATLTVESEAIPQRAPETISLVKVSTPTEARKEEISSLGLDLTEHGGNGFVEVVLHGDADARRLREHKFTYVTSIADLAARSARDSAADRRLRQSASASALPSGRTAGYRRLADYNNELKKLAADNSGIVKPITLPLKSLTGYSVEGIEISTGVQRRDGKPVFLQMGAHHAREWPSSEHTMEWAYELVNGYKAGNGRVRRLMGEVRTIVVPVVNPEGFNTSREAASALNDGRGGPDETPNLVFPYEYHRKNCRVNNPDGDDPEQGDCVQPGQPNVGLSQFGTDPNRNYGGFWGGPGANPGGAAPFGDYAQDYRGDGPFSERETQNVRRLVSARQVTTLITNHTFSNLLLRPPAIAAQGPPPDEPVYKALGDAMAAKNGYASQPSFMLYDTSGGTEDWSYYTTGGLGFTFEIGASNFHPPYAQTIAEYEGTSAAAANRGGNREAYFTAMESTANAARHSTLEGTAPPGAVLRLHKDFKTSTSPVIDENGETGAPILFDDTLSTVFDVPDSGRIDWGINPSTRPVAQAKGRQSTGSPSPPIVRNGQLASQPPCPTYFPPGGPETCGAGGFTDEQFTVPANGGGVDNGFVTVKIAFPDEADMDLEVYKADGAGNATGEPVGTSAGGSNPEQTKLGPDPAPGNYVARVINFAGGTTYDLNITFQSPDPFVPAKTESWTLTCETGGGRVLAGREVQIARGETKSASFGRQCAAATNTAPSSRCTSTKGKVRRKSVGRAVLGRNRTRQRRRFGNARRLKSRRGIDRYCVKAGGTMRVGYPTKRLNAGKSASAKRRTARKVVLAISTSKKFRIRRSRVGTSTRALRKRLRGERGFKVGKNVWYTAGGRSSRLLFRTRGGEVRELGLGDKRLTATRRSTKRFLRAWERRGL